MTWIALDLKALGPARAPCFEKSTVSLRTLLLKTENQHSRLKPIKENNSLLSGGQENKTGSMMENHVKCTCTKHGKYILEPLQMLDKKCRLSNDLSNVVI